MRLDGAGGHIDFASDDGRQDVDALGEEALSICRLYLGAVPSVGMGPFF